MIVISQVFILFFNGVCNVPQCGILDIFRPFVGFKDIRLVRKDAKRVS